MSPLSCLPPAPNSLLSPCPAREAGKGLTCWAMTGLTETSSPKLGKSSEHLPFLKQAPGPLLLLWGLASALGTASFLSPHQAGWDGAICSLRGGRDTVGGSPSPPCTASSAYLFWF